MASGPFDQARKSAEKSLKRLGKSVGPTLDRIVASRDAAVETAKLTRDRAAEFIGPLSGWWRTTTARFAELTRPVAVPTRAVVASVAPLIAAIPLSIAGLFQATIDLVARAIQSISAAMTNDFVPALRRRAESAEKLLTPTRVGVGIGLLASVLLVGSQFLDLRGVAVGAPLYQGRIASDVPTPITAVKITGSAHFWVMIPLALLAAVLTVFAARRRRRALGLLVAACGAVALVIALVIDLPSGLDSTAALPYSDATVRLLGGFWAELGAGLTLVVAGVMLALGDVPRSSPRSVAIGLPPEKPVAGEGRLAI